MLRSMKSPAMAGALVMGLAYAGPSFGQAELGTSISEAQIDQFVSAVIQVRDIQTGAAAQAQAAGSDQEGQAILQDANDQAAAAVEGVGLTVDEYNMILAQVQADPELLAMVQQRMAEQGGPAPEQAPMPQ